MRTPRKLKKRKAKRFRWIAAAEAAALDQLAFLHGLNRKRRKDRRWKESDSDLRARCREIWKPFGRSVDT